ncbi:Cytidine deaminase [Botrimarina colliarenosi]|uniref:Cytidine deaminase n=1 Tax=Botrimarina colliarenosi TaxID=2528001 RepID=A0A5C6AFH1_9BACT|nr:cytidine deaminase [Botrimarina colliarenosi]TWT96963.1 Cytidine deaminase [Botrimarina colliarenosi]
MAEPTPVQLDELVKTAVAIRERAYAPFSHFYVGAAILDDQGRVFAGVNVENSSYGLTICAERTAAGAAITAGAKEFVAVAVATPGAAAPCGACRQFLYELGPQCAVLLVDSDSGKVVRTAPLDEFLPNGFRLGR